MATEFHIHPVLKITLLGKIQEIPANIGVTSLCMNAVHTHDASGVLHVESPVKKDFTLGDFFAVWQKPFTKERVIDTVLLSEQQVIVTVNGKEVDTFDQTVMNDKDQIGIEVR
jgi:sulfur carrier protein ThiS